MRPSSEAPRHPVERLSELATNLLRAGGAPEGHARRVSQGLVSSDAHGVASHGLRVLPRYLEAIDRGELDPTGVPEVRRDAGSTALVHGGWTFGHVGADLATRLAVEKAHAAGVALVGLVESHHIGRLGEYVELAAAEGVILSMWCGGQGAEQPIAAPFGGRRAVLHTNPIAIGSPASGDRPVVVDIATTSVAGSKIDMARERGETLQPGLLLDAAGDPTTDPSAYFTGGALLPFGGHKGYGFMLIAEIMGRMLLGTDDLGGGSLGGPVMWHTGTTFLAVRCDLFVSEDQFRARMASLTDRIHAVPPQQGFDRVQVPGDLEADAFARSRRDGIPLEPRTWDTLVDLAHRLSVPIPA